MEQPGAGTDQWFPNPDQNRQALLFAYSFLLPRELFLQKLGESAVSDGRDFAHGCRQDLEEAAKFFGVSYMTARNWAFALGLMPAALLFRA